MRSRTKHETTQDLSTADLKALHAHPDAIVPDEDRDDNHKRGMRRLGHMGVAGLVAGVTVTSVFVGSKVLGGSNDSAERTTRENPVATASQSPGETESVSADIPEFGLSADKYKSDPEALVRAYYDQHNQYTKAGVPEGVLDDEHLYEVGVKQYVLEVSKPIDKAYIDATFVSNWKDIPRLASYVENTVTIAHQIRNIGIRTSGDNDREPFTVQLNIESDEILNTNPLVTSIDWIETNNADKNHAAEIVTPETLVEETGTDIFTWTEVDGQMKISDVTTD